MAVQPVPGGEKTEVGEKRCLRDPQHSPLAQTPPSGPLWRRYVAHPWDTHAQKSSTVLNLVTRRRFACHILLLSFLKNHSAHLGRERRRGGVSHAGAPTKPQHPLPALREAAHGRAPHTCSAGGACPGSLPGAALAAEPPSVAAASPLASAGERGTTLRSPTAIPAESLQPPQPPPHHDMNPTTGSPEGTAVLPMLCCEAQPTGRALTCSPVAILPSSGCPPGRPRLLSAHSRVG